ncbi:cytochrome b/b6 domain-containing protein [Sphingomonas sp. AR_OL41]|uniref:cytochrome b/b6 domain-containing protein n=1 Tax=Sphingomonas sp. AR_OL41 TaxID=3042729 RepID=UPI0024815A87|nr:cytochrome b/b6 domain-containing protein [Sphingomonas sp. AR_OL41]MDH7975136.1 cytochrome b/b6 domain-containing protein [Sphingomonas sp. AR_OL41]
MQQTVQVEAATPVQRHRRWVRLTHGLIALAVLVLIFSGVTILMAHPRLYWGYAGNDLIKPLFELPLGPNAHTTALSPRTPFFGAGGPATADRLAEPWNQNGWARSLHFLAAWFFLIGLLAYLSIGLLTGHARRALLPQRAELRRDNLWHDIKAHLRLPMPVAPPGPPYAILQKLAYAVVAFVALPLMFLTGIAMSPAITASYPLLLDMFGGTQSARTIHFFTFAFVAIFLLVHLVMIALTGPARQMRAMIMGK